MTYIRSKMIYGCGPYYYEVKSVREGKRVRQIFIRYIGKNPPAAPEEKKAYLEIEGAEDRRKPKNWDSHRYNQARMIAKATGCNYFQADALRKTAWRMGLDPDRFDWDQLQGKDLSYEDKMDKMEDLSGVSATTDEDREMEYANWLEENPSEDERMHYRDSSML